MDDAAVIVSLSSNYSSAWRVAPMNAISDLGSALHLLFSRSQQSK